MISEHATHLQRIGEGLAVSARIENGLLRLSAPNQPQETWAEFPIEQGIFTQEGEGYDATLEAFRKGERLGSETILERGIARLLEDSETAVRLVLNHREDGNPIATSEWKADPISIVPRPTLARAEGNSSWRLAQSLPCSEVRAYRKEADGSWTVEKEVHASREADVQDDAEPAQDRYATICRSIPVRPLAKPFAIRSVGRSEKDSAMNSYRM